MAVFYGSLLQRNKNDKAQFFCPSSLLRDEGKQKGAEGIDMKCAQQQQKTLESTQPFAEW